MLMLSKLYDFLIKKINTVKEFDIKKFVKNLLIILIKISLISYILFTFYKSYFTDNIIINNLQLNEILKSSNISKIIIENYQNAYLYSKNDSKIFELGINKYVSFEDKISKYIKDIPVIYKNSNINYYYNFFLYLSLFYLVSSMFDLKNSNFKFLKNDAIQSNKTEVKMEDVAGMEDTKKEVLDLVEIIMEPQKFKKMGAKIPSGILLEGPPGTGKTMLAKAISGKYKCPFYFISGSDFIQIFVGLGSQKVKDLFSMARKNKPCIIFIDEIDAIGKKRNGSKLTSNDERENILNALLVEMDGFENNDGILIIGATNRSDVLDSALLRPGRFDRIVKFSHPDMDDRKAILSSYIKKLNINGNKDNIINDVAGITVGFNNSELSNLCNEAIIRAVKNKKDILDFNDFEFAADYILLGAEKKSGDKNLDIVANHEIGHALTSFLLPKTESPRKVSIIPRTKGILGFSQNINKDEDKVLYQIDELEEKLIVLMGGRIAEKIKFNKFSTGAHDDLSKINSIIKNMITMYGMDRSLGGMQINLDNKDNFYSNNSDRYLSLVDESIQSYINVIEIKTEKLLRNNMHYFDKLVKLLLDKKTIYLNDIQNIVNSSMIDMVEIPDTLQNIDDSPSAQNSEDAAKEQLTENEPLTVQAQDDRKILEVPEN